MTTVLKEFIWKIGQFLHETWNFRSSAEVKMEQPSFPYLFHPHENGSQLPLELKVQIIRKMSADTFVKVLRSSKLANQFIEENRKYIKRSSCFLGAVEYVFCYGNKQRNGIYFKRNGNIFLVIEINHATGKNSSCWEEEFINYGLEYFHLENLHYSGEKDTHKNFLSACKKYNVRCHTLISSEEDLCFSTVDALKPRKVIFMERRMESFPSNINIVAKLQLHYHPTEDEEYATYILTIFASFYSGKIQIIFKQRPSPTALAAIYRCIKKMLNDRIPLKQLECDIKSFWPVFDEDQIGLDKFIIIEKIENRFPVSIVAFPARRGFLLLLRHGQSILSKVLDNHRDVDGLVDDFGDLILGQHQQVEFSKRHLPGMKASYREAIRIFLESHAISSS